MFDESNFYDVINKKLDCYFITQSLPPNHRIAIRLRYGFLDGHQYTYKEIGDVINLSPERIRQIVCSGLRRLRYPTRSFGMREYLV